MPLPTCPDAPPRRLPGGAPLGQRRFGALAAAQARAERVSGRVGQRFKTLEVIREAAKIRVTPELRTEATAALILPDVELAQEWAASSADWIGLAFDASLRRFARLELDGSVTVCRVTNGGEESVLRLPAHGQPWFGGPWMSPDGRFVAYGHGGARAGMLGGLRVWKLDGPEPEVLLDEPAGMYEYALAFRPNGRQPAIGHPDRSVSIYDLNTGRRMRRLKLDHLPYPEPKWYCRSALARMRRG